MSQYRADDSVLLSGLRAGDERAFVALVERYHGALVDLARVYVRDRGTAEEVAQETWLGVLRGLTRFEQRASLKTWIFRILVNCARTRGARDGRAIPFSGLESLDAGASEPAVAVERFHSPGQAWAGHWSTPPDSWETVPEEYLLRRETCDRVRAAIEALPPGQRAVITLRDLEGCTAREVCDLLQISPVNQRVLLHRARASVRRALEAYLADGSDGDGRG